MRLASLRKFALSLPGTTVVNQWGGLVFKVADKMFLLLALEAETLDAVVFKCTPEEFDELTEVDGIEQAPYFAKRHWVRVSELAAVPALSQRNRSKATTNALEQRIRHSYDLVVAKLPKKVQATLISQS
jgi:predicted DNA-binding protein (MmcQ/YjbR family)